MSSFRINNGYKQYLSSSGWAYTHRTVVAKRQGSPISLGNEVHHKNGIKTDNRPANLEVLSKADHKKIHNKK